MFLPLNDVSWTKKQNWCFAWFFTGWRFWSSHEAIYQTHVNVQAPSEILFSLGATGYLSPTSILIGLKMLNSISRTVVKVMASIRIVHIDLVQTHSINGHVRRGSLSPELFKSCTGAPSHRYAKGGGSAAYVIVWAFLIHFIQHFLYQIYFDHWWNEQIQIIACCRKTPHE